MDPQPDKARALLPVGAVLSATLLVTSVLDMADHAVAVDYVLGHLLFGLMTALLWLIARNRRPAREVTGRRGRVAA